MSGSCADARVPCRQFFRARRPACRGSRYARHRMRSLRRQMKYCRILFSIPLIFTIPLNSSGQSAKTAQTVTFYRDIAPIVYKECAPCHRPGESAPFSLLSYDDVKRHASQIAKVTTLRYMPPWLPEPGYGDFAEERRLTDAQINLIQELENQGSPAGVA